MTLSYLITENNRMANAIEQMQSKAKPFAICADADFSNFSFAGIKGSLFSELMTLLLGLETAAMPLACRVSFLGAISLQQRALHLLLWEVIAGGRKKLFKPYYRFLWQFRAVRHGIFRRVGCMLSLPMCEILQRAARLISLALMMSIGSMHCSSPAIRSGLISLF